MPIKEYDVQGTKFRMWLFDKIECHEQSYLIGYFLGNGEYLIKNHKKQANIYISSNCENIITNIKDIFSPDSLISSSILHTKPKFDDIKTYSVQFPVKFYDTFNKFGLMFDKKTRNFQNIKKSYMCSLILGLFDASGSLVFERRKDRNRLWVRWKIEHESINSLEKIQNFLTNEMNIASKLTHKKDGKTYVLEISNLDKVVEICKYMYSQTPSIYNTSKKQKVDSFINEYETILKTRSK